MKTKAAISAILLCTLALTASGCDGADLGTDNLIRPPKTVGDEAEIEQLIADTAGSGYTLKYPKSGNYRSAIVMKDLDNDGTDEAIAFYRTANESKAEVHMLVMYCTKGEWKLSENCTIEATDVDCVDFADVTGSGTLEILSGYTTYNSSINNLACHSYSKGKTNRLTVESSYSSFYSADFDGDGTNEVMLLSLYTTENDATANMLVYSEERNCLYSKASVKMDPNITRYKNITVTPTEDGPNALIVDGCFANDDTVTQIIDFNTELSVLRNPLFKEKDKNITQRSADIICTDINNDSIIEIPVVNKLPATADEDKLTVADKISWNIFYPQSEILSHLTDQICDYENCYSFTVPENWADGTYSVRLDSEKQSMNFFEWDGSNLGQKLFEIRAFKLEQWDIGEDSDAYTLIYKNESTAYAFADVNEESPLSISEDDIKTAFSLITVNNI